MTSRALHVAHSDVRAGEDTMAPLPRLSTTTSSTINSSSISHSIALSSPNSSNTSSLSSSSAVFCRVQPLDMRDGSGAVRMLSPTEAVQHVILATARKQQLKQQQQAVVKPRRVRKDNSARAKRYRAKKRGQLDDTLAEVEKLRCEVRELRTLRQILSEKVVITPFTTTGSPLRFVHAYFEIFRYGMQKPPEQRHGEAPNRNICGERQIRFMHAFTQPDVQFGASTGIAPAMEQWRMYSSLHSSLFLEFVSFRMDTIANCMLVSTTGVLHMRYTRATVAMLFPHAMAHEALVAKLVGREVHLVYTDRWYFDEHSKVCRYELIPDMVQALYDVVGSLEDVSWLLTGGAVIPDRAHFTPDTAARIELLDDSAFEDDNTEVEEDLAGAGRADTSMPPKDSSSSSSSPQPAAMAIDFLLS